MADICPAAHAANRTSVFALLSELNQTREDLEHLIMHPTLRLLEAHMVRVAKPPAASARAIIQAVPLEREAGKTGADADQAGQDDAGQALAIHDGGHASQQISA